MTLNQQYILGVIIYAIVLVVMFYGLVEVL